MAVVVFSTAILYSDTIHLLTGAVTVAKSMVSALVQSFICKNRQAFQIFVVKFR